MKRYILFILLGLFVSVAFAQEATINKIRYIAISPTEAKIYYGKKSLKGNVIIPNTVRIKKKEYKVTTISAGAFSSCTSLASITIPNSVTSIGDGVFSGCSSLTSITLPKDLTYIASYAFSNCKNLTSITLPNSVTSIGDAAFSGCRNLTSITIPEGVTKINSYAFDGCRNLTSITIPESVTSIGGAAFSGCRNLSSITIPNSITFIGGAAFYDCTNLKEVKVPDISEGGVGVFQGTNLSVIKGYNSIAPQWVINNILDPKNNTNYNYRNSSTYKWALDAQEKVKNSYNYYIYDNIMQLMSEWQKKKDYETTAQWRTRVNEMTQKEQLEKYKKQLFEKYIETRKPQNITSSLGAYDADYNIYTVIINGKYTLFVNVPLEKAEKVKNEWSKIEILEPEYGIINDSLGLLSAKFKLGKDIYHCTNTYKDSSDDLAINLPSLKIVLSDDDNKNSESEEVPIDESIDMNIPVTNENNANTFAVIIGNENYQQVAKVPYALNDAKIFAQYCEKTLGLPQKNIKTYTDATFGIMVSAVDNVKKIADAYNGEINVIFYYAGHGVPNEDSKDAFLLPVDADGKNTAACYAINKLYKELATLNAKRCTVFMDACFSGAQRGDGMLALARGVAIKPRATEVQGNLVVFTATNADETAYPYNDKGHGLFTYFILKKLQETAGDVTLDDLANYIRQKVSQESIVTNGKSQTPTLLYSPRIAEEWRNWKLK